MNITEISIPEDKINKWDDLENLFQTLYDITFESSLDFRLWLVKLSDLESYISEDLAWRYIKMTCNTEDSALEKDYLYFVSEIQPKLALWQDKINHKISASPFLNEMQESAYQIYFRKVKNEIELFREASIPVFVEMQTDAQKYAAITGSLFVEHEGKQLTLQQASAMLRDPNRILRKEIYDKILNVRLNHKNELDDLLNKLIRNRQLVAENAGFSNFRDYQHQALARFDYTVQDCFDFHEAVAEIVVPMADEIMAERKNAMALENLKPYDLDVDPLNRAPLKPFSSGQDLLEKSIAGFSLLDPFFSDVLQTMAEKKHFDLESRKGKAPGGYNYPLAKTGYPFIFMNAAQTLRDLETMVHEAGHAIHSVLSKDLELNAFKDCPSEVAELASMSMELISMDFWHLFFDNESDLLRAKIEQLHGVINTLPWIACVDAFQHWLYTNPKHSESQRNEAWLALSKKFGSKHVDWSGYEDGRAYQWQKQLHIYEVPFYYIEYGFAQLGAIAVWKTYKENAKNGLEKYKNALQLGYTKSIAEIYATAGAEFRFTADYIATLFDFVKEELNRIKAHRISI